MRYVRGLILPPLLIIAVSTLGPVAHTQEGASAEKKTEPSYVVVLKNGQCIPARTKPVSGFGKVRYMEPGGTNRVLPISEVDIEKTREANAQVSKNESSGTLSVGGELAASTPLKRGGTGQPTGGAKKTQNQTVKV